MSKNHKILIVDDECAVRLMGKKVASTIHEGILCELPKAQQKPKVNEPFYRQLEKRSKRK